MPNWKTDGCYGELLMSSSPSAANEQHFFRVQSRVAVTPGKRKLKGHPCSFRVLVASQQSKRETQMPFRRISMMPRTVVLFCIENDTPFLLSGYCRKDCITPKAGTHRSSETAAPLKPKYSHRPKRNPHTVRAKFAAVQE